MSFINPDLTLLKIENEITNIGEYVGYYWELIPNDNNINVSGSSNNYNVSSPNTNNTSYAYSNLTRNDNWTITCICQANSNMFIGVAENLSENFPNASSPSMQMLKYGVLMDTIEEVNDLFPIVNGVVGSGINITAGQTLKITYDGITLKFFVDNNEVLAFQQIVSISPIYLVVGSFYGGSIKNITFSGSGSGGGGTQNLEEVLTNGNDGGNLNVNNINNLSMNGFIQIGGNNNYRISKIGENLDIIYFQNNTQISTPIAIRQDVILFNNSEFVQGATFNEGLSIPQSENILIATNTNQEFKIYGSPSSPQFNLIHNDKNTLITTDLLEIDQSTMTYTFGNQELANPSIPTLKIQGVANDTTFEGIILDSVINPPNAYINSIISNQTTKNISSGTPTSILKIDIGAYNYFNSFNSLLSSLSFENNIISSNPNNPITALFYLSDTLDGDLDSSTPLYVGFSTDNINPLSGNPNVSKTNILLSNIFNNATDNLYLNVKITSSNPCVCSFSDFNINMNTQTEVNYKLTITPNML
jgi:hypothetical protein